MGYQTVTLATLQTTLLGKVDTAAGFTAAEATIALNDALKLWNLLTGRWRKSVSVTIHPSSSPYVGLQTTGTLIWPMRMTLTDGTPIGKGSIAGLDMGIPGWEAATVGDAGVPNRITFWAPRSLTSFAVYPKVTANTGIVVDGITDTPVLSAGGDFIDLDEGLTPLLLNYAAHLLRWKFGGPRFFGTASSYEALLRAAAEENAAIRATSVYKRLQQRDTDQAQAPRRLAVPAPAEAE